MIRIRPYRNSDEETILSWDLDEDTFYQWSFGWLGEYPLTEEKFRKTADYSRFTALDGPEVVGFFTVRNPEQKLDRLRFGFVLVDPARQGQGIGKAMLSQALSYAFDIYKAERVSLGVYEKNAPAFACYRGIGFLPTGATESYTIRGEEMKVIEMAVDSPAEKADAVQPAGDLPAGKIEVLRAEEEWQRAGAYSVRIEAMNRKYHIPLRMEVDDLDCDGGRHIVLLDDGYPFATCRIYGQDGRSAHIGRMVVMPEYRGMEYGRRAVEEAEDWIRELGYEEILLDARTVAVGFYEKMDYEQIDDTVFRSGPFECVRMRKILKD